MLPLSLSLSSPLHPKCAGAVLPRGSKKPAAAQLPTQLRTALRRVWPLSCEPLFESAEPFLHCLHQLRAWRICRAGSDTDFGSSLRVRVTKALLQR